MDWMTPELSAILVALIASPISVTIVNSLTIFKKNGIENRLVEIENKLGASNDQFSSYVKEEASFNLEKKVQKMLEQDADFSASCLNEYYTLREKCRRLNVALSRQLIEQMIELDHKISERNRK